MRRYNVRIAVCAVTAVISLSGMELTADASGGLSSVLPSAGIDYSMSPSDATSLSEMKEEVERENSSDLTASTAEVVVKGTGEIAIGGMLESNEQSSISDKKIEKTVVVVSEGYTKDLREASNASKLSEEEEGFKSLVIAKVNNYVNVRDIPSEEGNIVGKLYDKSVGTFMEEENGWYKISSGSVEGYVKGEFCVTGDDAVELAKEVGTRIATVTTTTLKVREEPSTDAIVLGMVPIEDELIVAEELDGWVKVNIEEGDGYVSTDFVTLSTEFVKAESIEEEKARLAKEQAAREEAQKAAAKKAASQASSGSSSSEAPVTYAASGGSAQGQAVVNYALQFVGNPYVYGGSSLTNGTDCSGFVMSVYRNFGVSLPHSSAADRSVGATVNGLENAQPGDIICYSGHVGIYVGNGQIVHASTSRTGIIVSSATYRSILSIRRIF